MGIIPIWMRNGRRIHIGDDWRWEPSPVNQIFRHHMIPVVLAALVEDVVDAFVKKHGGNIID